MIGGLVALVVVVLLAWMNEDRLQDARESLPTTSSAGVNGSSSVVTVRVEPLQMSTSLLGKLNAGNLVNLVAPFDGSIKSIDFQYNQPVTTGTRLMTLDPTELQLKLWDAKTAYIDSKQALQELKNWSANAEVQNAQQAVEGEQERLINIQRKEQETKMLYDKGIVSRNEYTSISEQLHDRQRSLTRAEHSLQVVLDKANDERLEEASIKAAAAHKRLEALEEKFDRGTIMATIDAVVFAARNSDPMGKSKPGKLSVGQKVSEGDVLLTLAEMDSLSIESKVDELEVNKLQVGQTVVVSGDAFPGVKLQGKLVEVSAQADVAMRGGGLATYTIKALIDDIPDDQRQHLRIGMSASMRIVTYDHPNAIMLPVSAVQGNPGNAWVMRVNQATGETEQVMVRTGATTVDSVEILEGLQAGDQIVLPGK